MAHVDAPLAPEPLPLPPRAGAPSFTPPIAVLGPSRKIAAGLAVAAALAAALFLLRSGDPPATPPASPPPTSGVSR